jgi:ABC-type Na+ transport system ATPase subunit NatA
MAEISLVNVSKKFGMVAVIDNLSLTVKANEFVVFLGPSGSGKSTLLRMIAGFENVDEGELLIDGVRCEHLPPGQRNVAMVFQNYALYPHMTVRENMAFGLQNIGVAANDIETRVGNAAKILEMDGLLDRARPSCREGSASAWQLANVMSANLRFRIASGLDAAAIFISHSTMTAIPGGCPSAANFYSASASLRRRRLTNSENVERVFPACLRPAANGDCYVGP